MAQYSIYWAQLLFNLSLEFGVKHNLFQTFTQSH